MRPVPLWIPLGRFLRQPHHPLHNIVHIGKVPLQLTLPEQLDLLSG